MKKIISNIKLSKLSVTALFLISSIATNAQVADIETKFKDYGTDLKTVLDVAVGTFAIVGGFIIFMQYMQGNEQAQKNLVKFGIGLGIFGIVDLIAKVFIP